MAGKSQVLARHQVRVSVVVHQDLVLIRTGDAVDAEAPIALIVVVTRLHPQPRRFTQDFLDALIGRQVEQCFGFLCNFSLSFATLGLLFVVTLLLAPLLARLRNRSAEKSAAA